MDRLRKSIWKVSTPQWILITAALVNGVVAMIVGVNDNLPGILTLYIALGCIAAAWVWNWRSVRDFWILLGIAIAAFPLGAVLHNLFYALAELANGMPFLRDFLGFLSALFFIVAVIAAAPAGLVALAGGIYTSWQGMGRATRLNRSCRRFKEGSPVKEKTLRRLIGYVRQSASGANLQPLKFILSFTEDQNSQIFPALSWAGYMPEWGGPAEGERPSAYIIILGDTAITKSFQYDAGIASQSITLGASELGLGACLIGSIKRTLLREALSISDQYEILLVIALGKPAEKVVLDEIGGDGDVRYWRDERNVHHVPKRGIDELILEG